MDNVEQLSEQSRDDRLAHVIEGYLAASEAGTPPSRADLLDEHPDLADDLAACLDTLDFIGHSLGQGPATSVLECGQQFGEYQILRELGRGGMGVVYEAFHLSLERRVALKVLSGRAFEDERQRERFLLEAKTAASLHHTNIVPIFEVGQLDGVCYFAMQFIKGRSLGSIVRELRNPGTTAIVPDQTIFPPGTIVRDQREDQFDESGEFPTLGTGEQFTEGNQSAATDSPSKGDGSSSRTDSSQLIVSNALSASALHEGPNGDRYFREAARLIAQAADALAHAHSHGVVHRDVKPSNLILDGDSRVWVADFGLAFRSNDPRQEGGSHAVGTPSYMSPEQVRPGSFAVDHRTDIYSLGATLYEMLTLLPIFEGDTSLAVLTQIASVDPVPPRKINSLIPLDLDCIVRRATAKRPADRYADAAGLAADLRRYLNFEPVRARRLGPLGRLILWCRRDPRLAAVMTTAALLLATVTIVSHWAILRARNAAIKAREVAVRARERTEEQLVLTKTAENKAHENFRLSLFQQARATRLSFQNGRRWDTLALIHDAQEIRPDPKLRDEAIAALSIPDARLHKRITTESDVEHLAFCPNKGRIAFGCRDGSIRLWNFSGDSGSDSEPVVLAAAGHDVRLMALSQCGRYVAALETDGPIALWDVDSGNLVARLELDEFRPLFINFLEQQSCLVALGEGGTCRRWEIAADEVRMLADLETSSWRSAIAGPDGQSVTLVGRSGNLEIWNLLTGDHRKVEGISLSSVRSIGTRRDLSGTMKWDPSGKQLAAGGQWGTVDIWPLGESQPARSIGAHRGPVSAIAFSPTAPLLATSGYRDATLRLWDAMTGDQIATLREPLAGALSISFSPDGRYLAAGGSDKTIWLWEVETAKSLHRLPGHNDVIAQVTLSPDGKYIASGSEDGSILLWPLDGRVGPFRLADVVEDQESRVKPRACAALSFSLDSRRLVARLRNNALRVWDVESLKLVASLDSSLSFGGAGGQWLPNNNELIRSSNRTIQKWTVEVDSTPTTVATVSDGIVALAACPDGRSVVASTRRNRLEIFDLTAQSPNAQVAELPTRGLTLAVDPDSSLLAVGDRAGTVHVFNLPELTKLQSWQETDDELTSLSFSPSGRWLAIAGLDGTVRVRTVPKGELVATLPGQEGGIRSLAFGPADSLLVTGGQDKLVHVWNLDSLKKELANLDLAW